MAVNFTVVDAATITGVLSTVKFTVVVAVVSSEVRKNRSGLLWCRLSGRPLLASLVDLRVCPRFVCVSLLFPFAYRLSLILSLDLSRNVPS
ncbi:hypothetical protein [uncultured Bacteroides sp.]|uniref:hypothetical protein n=1 Tax=uncultured Bacteroides sp. TaxID=162156 RepID=UPI0025996AD7|nr:hypothetical protein [uncultured Bacteroides sp.]